MSAPATAEKRRPSLAATHSNYSHDWWTPQPWIDWVSETFGHAAWFDPCPQDWSPSRPSGLEVRWPTDTYVNHPGARGSTPHWWQAYMDRSALLPRFIWCAFSVEQLRHMRPSALELPGWLVAPRERTAFIWGGPDTPATKTSAERIHGQPMKSPGNWAVWWTTVKPAKPPIESIVTRTGNR